MSFTIFRVKVTLRFSLAVFLCLIPLLPGKLLPLLLLAIALHEAGHLLYLAFSQTPVRSITLSLRGVLMDVTPGALSPRQEILLNIAGPLMNILSAALSILLFEGMDSTRFTAVSLAVGAVNLIPFGNTDGAVALESALIGKEHTTAAKITAAVRLFLGFALLISIAAAWIASGWRWYYLLGVYYFAVSLVEEKP